MKSSRREPLLLALLVLATFFAYAPALCAGYVWDDNDYVSQNPLLYEPDGLSRIWFSTDSPSQYFPLTYTLFRAEYHVWGLDPRGYHAVNVLLHAVNALLVTLVMRRARIPGALLAGAIFALHPVHVESVAWITERKNVLSLFFMLGSAWWWLRFSEPMARRPGAFYAAAFGAYVLALLAKTTACTFPALQVALLWLRDGRVSMRRLTQTLPFLVTGVVMGLVSIWWERHHQGASDDRFVLAPLEAILVATRAVWFYLGKLAWPSPLIFSYPKFPVDPGDPLQYAWLVAGGLLLWALWRWRAITGPGPLAASLVFVGSLSPLLGFVPLFTFFYTYVADHYQYVASLGPIALFAAGAVAARNRWLLERPVVAGATVSLLLAMLAALTFQQAQTYEDRETLWRDVISKNPDSWMAHANLGRDLIRQDRLEEATRSYRRSASLAPEAARPRVLVGLGQALRRQGRDQEALDALQQAVDANGELLRARLALARQLARMDQRAPARVAFDEILRLSPGDAEAHLALARLVEDRSEVRRHLRAALAVEPQNAVAGRDLALLLLECDADAAAVDEASRLAASALSRRPRDIRALEALARVRAQSRDVAGALKLLDRALSLHPAEDSGAPEREPRGDRAARLRTLRQAIETGAQACALPPFR